MSEGKAEWVILCQFLFFRCSDYLSKETSECVIFRRSVVVGCRYRVNEEKAEWVIYVTDVGQAQHFDMFLKATRMAGWLPALPAPKEKDKPKGGGKEGEGGGKGKGKAKAKKGQAQDGAPAAASDSPAPASDTTSAQPDAASAGTEPAPGGTPQGGAAANASAPPSVPFGGVPPVPYTGPPVRVDHVGFGLVLGEDGKRFRTRSSEVVRLVDLLDEAVGRARQGLIERGREVYHVCTVHSVCKFTSMGVLCIEVARALRRWCPVKVLDQVRGGGERRPPPRLRERGGHLSPLFFAGCGLSLFLGWFCCGFGCAGQRGNEELTPLGIALLFVYPSSSLCAALSSLEREGKTRLFN